MNAALLRIFESTVQDPAIPFPSCPGTHSAALYCRVTPGNEHDLSLRLERPEYKRLAWAFGASVVLHLLCYGAYELGQEFRIQERIAQWAQRVKVLAALIPPPPARERLSEPEPPLQELPMIFVDVNPALATADPPPDAKFYSNRNSEAGNPEMDEETDLPKITGERTHIVKAEDTPRLDLNPLRPAFTPAEQDQEPTRPRARAPSEPGDLALARPESNPRPGDGTAERPRPRTVREARLANRDQLVGERMKQEGGVKRLRLDPGFDVKATPFGNYDAMFIETVQTRWYALLDTYRDAGFKPGKVVLRFRLHHDGQISNLEIVEENVGLTLTLFCRGAIEQPAPYERWPRELRLAMGRDYREMNFTFYYY